MSRRTTVGVLVLAAAVGFKVAACGPSIPELRRPTGWGAAGRRWCSASTSPGPRTGIVWWGLSGAWPPDLAAGRRRAARRRGGRDRLHPRLAGGAGGGVRARGRVRVVVVEINVLFAEAFGERTTAMLNLLGARFGAGAISGRWPWPPWRVPAAVLHRRRGGPGGPGPGQRPADGLAPPVPGGDRPPFGLVSGFVALCALYVGAGERDRWLGDDPPAAGGAGPGDRGQLTAGYWAAITAGRLLAIPLASRVPAPAPPGPCRWRRPGWARPTSWRWPCSPTP